MERLTIRGLMLAAFAPFLLLIPTTASAGCFPVPAFWGFAIVCTLDREGTGVSFMCGAKDLESKDGNYRMTGKCVHKIPVSDSFGGDHGGPVERTYFFEAKATSKIFNPLTPENTQESVELFTDAAHQDELGKIQGIYTCKKDPYTDVTASCTTDNYATTVDGHDVLLNFQPLLRGIAAGDGNIGTSKEPLKAAKPAAYTGVWAPGSDAYYLWRAKGWASFVDKWEELSATGLRLEDIESFQSGNDTYFTGVWREGNDAHYLWHTRGWESFTDKWQELAKKNLRLTNIETYARGNQRYYVGVWRAGKDAYYLWNVKGWKAFTDKWKELGNDNYRLVDIETYPSGDDTAYVGVWRHGTDGYYLWNVDSWGKLVAKWKELAPKNYRLVDVDIRRSGNRTHYVGVWRSGSAGYALWHSRTWKGMVDKWKELGAQNMRLISLDSG